MARKRGRKRSRKQIICQSVGFSDHRLRKKQAQRARSGRHTLEFTGQAVIVDGGQITCQDNQRYMELAGLKP